LKRLKSILDFFVFSNLYVALPVTCMAHLSWKMLALDGTPYTSLGFIYCATLTLYSLHRIIGLEKIEPGKGAQRHQWARKNKTTLRLVFGLGVTGTLVFFVSLFKYFFFGYQGNDFQKVVHEMRTVVTPFEPGIIAFLAPVVIALLYSVPLLKWKGEALRLRDIPGIKIFLIAAVVAWITVVFPLYENTFPLDQGKVIQLFLHRFCFIFAITIPFDIRDVEADKLKELKTIPLKVGVRNSKLIAVGALAASDFLSFDLGSSAQNMGLLFSLPVSALILLYASPRRSEYFYSLLVEGTMLIQWALVLGAEALLSR